MIATLGGSRRQLATRGNHLVEISKGLEKEIWLKSWIELCLMVDSSKWTCGETDYTQIGISPTTGGFNHQMMGVEAEDPWYALYTWQTNWQVVEIWGSFQLVFFFPPSPAETHPHFFPTESNRTQVCWSGHLGEMMRQFWVHFITTSPHCSPEQRNHGFTLRKSYEIITKFNGRTIFGVVNDFVIDPAACAWS